MTRQSPTRKAAPREPLRQGIVDEMPKSRDYRGNQIPVFPTISQEMALIQKQGDPQVFAIDELAEYRCLIADDPRGQYKALVVKQKAMPGVNPDTLFWSPIRANAHTGPAIVGFSDTVLALAFAQDWLLARVDGKLRAAAQKALFMRAKNIKPKGDHP